MIMIKETLPNIRTTNEYINVFNFKYICNHDLMMQSKNTEAEVISKLFQKR